MESLYLQPLLKRMQFKIDLMILKGSFFSRNLDRKVTFRWAAPGNYQSAQKPFPVLLMNDGQDFVGMDLENTLSNTFKNNGIHPFIYVGIETNQNRIHDYGTASAGDYKGRGRNALQYSKFIVEEFIPFLKREFYTTQSGRDWVYCGMSLGGLSAFDIAYTHASLFGKTGVFSGSFWWRKKAYQKRDLSDRSRIVLDVIKNGQFHPHLKFWFQCGTEDELADRNQNGIIDSIDDTIDVIKELQQKGYTFPGDITYVELEGGKHNLPTWAAVFPEFLKWAFGQEVPKNTVPQTPPDSML